MVNQTPINVGLALSLAVLAFSTSSCTTEQTTAAVSPVITNTSIEIDGSSTVFPITDAIANQFRQTATTKPDVTVAVSGTKGGFTKFCAGETDINNASRPITTAEMEKCRQGRVPYIEIPVAFDALTVVVNPKNTWAKDITVAELKKIWEPAAQGKIKSWRQVRPEYPDQPLTLYGPGNKSGTFDYFTEVVMGEQDQSRTDYTASEDDNVLVRGVENNPGALSYFGYAYYEQEQNRLKALAVDNGKGAVAPSTETVTRATYQPLARPLFIYVNAQAAQKNPQLRHFVEFYLQNASQTVKQVGYIPLAEEGYKIAAVHFQAGKVGTVFAGKPQPNLTIAELLRKQKAF